MATSKSSSVSGRPLGEQAREIVYKVAEHLKGMKKEHDLTFNLAEETSTATEPSVIVMDNAKYHCVEEDKKPTSGSLKKNIQDWLHKHNIDYDENFTKVELLMLVQNVQREPVYKIDQLINNFGHQVLRLPPYHPDLNPIELVWGAIKGQVAKDVAAKTLDQKMRLCDSLFTSYTAEEWKKCCEHVKKVEQDYWEKDHIIDNEIDRLIISVNQNESEDDSDISDFITDSE
ncbi:uncharacterized protein LOC129000353 [Macrosteles quadrilineatus]|uniref:uncharacterized protein LOC129000353 n=1 Tax=Macrosteles quadrilineatus TaxID=74068 RepID=UPI0023E0F969|nr:uncharacterized protein LOC129000353 [Macrosteles quadrilineatus]